MSFNKKREKIDTANCVCVCVCDNLIIKTGIGFLRKKRVNPIIISTFSYSDDSYRKTSCSLSQRNEFIDSASQIEVLVGKSNLIQA